MTILHLTPDMQTRSGHKVIASKVESNRSKDAHARRRIAEIKRAREKLA